MPTFGSAPVTTVMFFSAAAARISKFRMPAAIFTVAAVLGSPLVMFTSTPLRLCVQIEREPRPEDLGFGQRGLQPKKEVTRRTDLVHHALYL